jgi:hypothetical protein
VLASKSMNGSVPDEHTSLNGTVGGLTNRP